MTISHARRRFVAALGGPALLWPLSARGQQPAPGKWRVAMLMPNRRQDVLRQGLRELGYVEGDNLVIEARSIERADRIAALAAELGWPEAGRDRRDGNSGDSGRSAGNQEHSDRDDWQQRSGRYPSGGESCSSGRQRYRPQSFFAGVKRKADGNAAQRHRRAFFARGSVESRRSSGGDCT